MSQLEEFKQFISSVPKVKEDVLSNRYSWQQLYEIYVLYGKDDKFWQPYKSAAAATSSIDLSTILEVVKNVDLNALSSGLGAIEKVLNMASGLFAKDEEPTINQKNKWYDE